MRPRLIVVSGTGTEIGKTHLSCALLRRWGRTARCCGLKPVETGVRGDAGDDGRALAAVSTFHVKPSAAPYAFPRPVSPHLAAREAGKRIELGLILDWVTRAANGSDGALIELPGGLFSPLADGVLNVDLAIALKPEALVLVAPDRLGVLHDVGATERAARAVGANIEAIALVGVERPDEATGSNAAEIPIVARAPVFGPIPRATIDALADDPLVAALLDRIAPR